MNLWAFLLLSLVLCSASPVPSMNVTDNGEQRDILEVNNGLHLIEGDIVVPMERSSILGSKYLWKIPIPYMLSANLRMKHKGIILRAFEQFRLKSCIDFKPRTTEKTFILVENGVYSRVLAFVEISNLVLALIVLLPLYDISLYCFLNSLCSSSVGQVSSSKSQTLYIGDGCGTKAAVEHQFLHALGFYHEQSRYDRDDYVTIKQENIKAGYEIHFKKYSENVSSVQGTPYDYMSLMHYGKNDYSNGNGSTIITKCPEFQDVIGQSLDMSEYDAIELNTLYKCNSSTSFLHHCSFDDESLCQMNFCSSAKRGWQRVSSVRDVNVTDHTYLHKNTNGTSFFIHFSVEGRKEGDSARLETREMVPTRDCKVQCLQFYYYHSDNKNDKLNIWIKEYQNEADSRGTFRLMDRITGPPDNYWRLHHVSLNAKKPFRLVFEARKGAGNSSGGFSLDDINIVQTECSQIWQIRNFRKLKNATPTGSYQFSPLYYSSEGYRYQIFLRNFETYFSMYFRLISGEFDDQLQWPCIWRQVTLQVLDQNPHMQRQMSYERSFTTDPAHLTGNTSSWDNPRNNGTKSIIGNETVFVMKGAWGYGNFMSKNDLTKREYIKGGAIIFLFSMQDISDLLQNNSLPCPNVKRTAIRKESTSGGRTLPSSLILVGLCLYLLN